MTYLSSKTDEELFNEYLFNPGDFRRNVQEPSTRVTDRALLTRLAQISLQKFPDNAHVCTASIVVLCYRYIEGVDLDSNVLLDAASNARNGLHPEQGFNPCRWYMSLGLAEAAVRMKNGDALGADHILSLSCRNLDSAFRQGQIFTNVVKSVLIRLAIRSAVDLPEDVGLPSDADAVLSKSQIASVNYRFQNEFAYEEMAHVFTMLRQIYKWRHRNIGDSSFDHGGGRRSSGLDWTCVGSPFEQLIMNFGKQAV